MWVWMERRTVDAEEAVALWIYRKMSVGQGMGLLIYSELSLCSMFHHV